MYIDDGSGNLIHNRTTLKFLNQGRGILISTDRLNQVRGDTKYKARGLTRESLVTKAFKSMEVEGEESDNILHKTGDFCVALVEAKGEGQQTKERFMILGIM